MADPINTAAPSTPDAAAANAPAPPTPPVINAPAQTPDLSGVVQAAPGSQPNLPTAALGTASAEYQAAADRAKTPVVDPKVPHAKLLAMIQAIGIGLSSFGAAGSSGGREGGAPMVEKFYGEEQQQKIQAHEARVAEKNAEVQQHITLGDTAMRMAISWQNLDSMHDEMELRHVQVAGAKQGLQAGALDLQNKAQEMFDTRGQVPPGWSVDANTGQVSQSGQTPTSGAAPSVGAQGTPTADGAGPAGATPAGAPTATGAAAGTPSIFTQRQSMIVDAAAQELGKDAKGNEDPLVVGARKILVDPSSTPTQKRQAVIAVQNKAGISADVVKTLTAKADLAARQQQIAAGPAQAAATLAKTQAETAASRLSAEKTRLELKSLQTGNSNLSGMDYLHSLPAGRQAMVSAIGEGRTATNSRTFSTAQGQALLADVTQAYPGFDQSKAESYFATRKDFTSGKTATGINSLNTVANHLSRMYDNTSKWSTIPGLKSLSALSGGEAARLNSDKQAVATELSKAYAAGQISEGEIKEWNKRLDVWSPAELKSNITEIGGLLEGKLSAYQNQWENGMPTGAVTPIQIISPAARGALDHIGGKTAQGNPTPQSHVFDSKAWAAANPGKDVTAAIGAAKQQGYEVK